MDLTRNNKILIGPSTFGQKNPEPLNLLTSAGYEVIENPYGRRLTKTELLSLLSSGAIGLIAGLESIDREVLKKTNLKVISRCGAGMSNVDLEAAKKMGIKVCYTPYGPTTAVAELTVAALLNILRSVSIMDKDLHKGKWTKITGNQLEGKTVVIVGFGRIGQKLASLLSSFGVDIIAVDERQDQEFSGVSFASLHDALPKADIVAFHLSGQDQIMGKQEFSLVKKGAILLNAARGQTIDEQALVQALDDGKIKSAWIDTFINEPYLGRLQKYPQVLLTPHVGSYTVEGRKRMEVDAVENLIGAFKEIKNAG